MRFFEDSAIPVHPDGDVLEISLQALLPFHALLAIRPQAIEKPRPLLQGVLQVLLESGSLLQLTSHKLQFDLSLDKLFSGGVIVIFLRFAIHYVMEEGII